MKIATLSLIAILIFSCKNTPSDREYPLETKSRRAADTTIIPELTGATAALKGTYCNERYGFCIAYPEHEVQMERESESGDGAWFKDRDGNTFMMVFGRTNPDPASGSFDTKKEMQAEIASFLKDSSRTHAAITYARTTRDFYAFSGKKGDTIYYQKGILKGDDLAIAIFHYGEQQKARYDVMVTAMSKSFH